MAAGGAEGNRTPDLCSAIAALSHLSYSPATDPGAPGGAPLSEPRMAMQPGRAAFAERFCERGEAHANRLEIPELITGSLA